MARLYVVARSGGTRATPHPPEGVARGQPIRGGALVPTCASHGDDGSPYGAPPAPGAPGPRGVGSVFREID
jgi:hypothetical protein